jgi:hypothetical protein
MDMPVDAKEHVIDKVNFSRRVHTCIPMPPSSLRRAPLVPAAVIPHVALSQVKGVGSKVTQHPQVQAVLNSKQATLLGDFWATEKNRSMVARALISTYFFNVGPFIIVNAWRLKLMLVIH